MDDRKLLSRLFQAAVSAADPHAGIGKHLPAPPERGRTVVVGAGKGAAQMAAALESLWPGPLSGTVVTRYGYGCSTRFIEILEASHPVPDMAGLVGTRPLFAAVSGLSQAALVIPLINGRGPPLSPPPPPRFTPQHDNA